jgi:hypothetical protein
MIRSTSLLVAAGMLSGCAARTAEPPAPAALEPAGTYAFSSTYEGQPITGTMVIRQTESGYTGVVEAKTGPPPVPVYAVTVEGNTMTVFGDVGGDDLIVTLEFTGQQFAGSWVVGFEGGDISGSKLPDGP